MGFGGGVGGDDVGGLRRERLRVEKGKRVWGRAEGLFIGLVS